MNWGDGSPNSLGTVSGSAGNYTVSVPGHVFPLNGSYTYTIKIYEDNGTLLKSGSNTISVADGSPFASYLTNTAIAAGSNNVALPLTNGTIYTANILNFPTSGTINITTAAGVTTNVTYTGLINTGFPSYQYGFSGVNGGTGTLKTGDVVTVGVNATENSPTGTLTALTFTDPRHLGHADNQPTNVAIDKWHDKRQFFRQRHAIPAIGSADNCPSTAAARRTSVTAIMLRTVSRAATAVLPAPCRPAPPSRLQGAP